MIRDTLSSEICKLKPNAQQLTLNSQQRIVGWASPLTITENDSLNSATPSSNRYPDTSQCCYTIDKN